jgi:hypothetical protein
LNWGVLDGFGKRLPFLAAAQAMLNKSVPMIGETLKVSGDVTPIRLIAEVADLLRKASDRTQFLNCNSMCHMSKRQMALFCAKANKPNDRSRESGGVGELVSASIGARNSPAELMRIWKPRWLRLQSRP